MDRPSPPTSAPTPTSTPTYFRLDTRQLFQNGLRQVEIVHGDVRYCLRLTRENKLILTK
ncbi:MAG: hemin uptake protein HemP [Azovibrio sp.]|nr:hemin uptake protein HemP [Azovibrio sp.]